jgi:F-type H+-transporting ATPase subunit delta
MKGDVKTATAYARALFESTWRAGVAEQTEKDLRAVVQTLASSPELQRIADGSSTVPGTGRVGAVRAVFKSHVGAITLFIMEKMAAWSHLSLLPQVADIYSATLRAHAGHLRVNVQTAQPLTDAELDTLRSRLAPMGAQTIEFDVHLDPSLLAGLTLQANDLFIDASLAGRLGRLKMELSKA